MDQELVRKLKAKFEGMVVKEGTNTYAIYYQTNPTFSSEVEDDKVNWDKYTFLFNVQADNLEDIFRQMQGEVWSPNGEARELITALGLCHTSMSVGDIVRDFKNQKWYVVANCGFDEIKVFFTNKGIHRVA